MRLMVGMVGMVVCLGVAAAPDKGSPRPRIRGQEPLIRLLTPYPVPRGSPDFLSFNYLDGDLAVYYKRVQM